MLLLAFFILLVTLNLFHVIAEKSEPYYKDIRFWLIMLSLVVLITVTLEGYSVQ